MLAIIRNYFQLLGRRIDQIVLEHEQEPYKQDSKFSFLLERFLFCSCVWNPFVFVVGLLLALKRIG